MSIADFWNWLIHANLLTGLAWLGGLIGLALAYSALVIIGGVVAQGVRALLGLPQKPVDKL